MSQTIITEKFTQGGNPVDVTSVVFSDKAGLIGVQRTDTGVNVVAPGTALGHDSTGVYDYTIDDPAPNLTYTYWITFVSPLGVTLRYQKTIVATPTGSPLPVYLSAAAADALAAQVPALKAWPAANDAQKTAALVQATLDVDRGQKYQGRKYDLTQSLEFPRMAYEAAARVRNWGVMAQPIIPPGYGDVVWDWDTVNLVPLVPNNVLLAVIYQADSILLADRDERLAAQHDGVASQSNSGLSESYRDRPQNAGLRTGLCRRAYLLLEQYKLAAGRML
jgi:hypothetical protein